ncbi:unnamed protein product [Camellia sinensis]
MKNDSTTFKRQVILSGRILLFSSKEIPGRNSYRMDGFLRWTKCQFFGAFSRLLRKKQFCTFTPAHEHVPYRTIGKDHRRNRVANAYFSLSVAVGNVLGFATGSYSGWFKIFPCTVTSACNADCANLKSAFFLAIAFIVITTYISISVANQLPLNHGPSHLCEEMPEQSSHAQEAFFWQLFGTFRCLSGPVWVILLVTALTWFGWFPFLLFDTDWMGREIYGGKPNEGHNYNRGVRIGAFDLMLNSVVLGITSVFMEMCRKLGAGVVWGISNILMSLCFVSMLIVSHIANNVHKARDDLPPDGIVAAVLVVLQFLVFLWHITYSVLCALISSHVESLGLGQGLSMGVLNVDCGVSWKWAMDQLFGGGNSPSLAVTAVAAFTSGL